MTFINQHKISTEIIAMINILNEQGVNILLQGPAGCGKTTLAHIFCNGLSKRFSMKWSGSIPYKGHVNLDRLTEFRCIFIDEIHLYKEWELLYRYMDSGEKIFIFCTTEYGDIPEPFLSRCIRFTFEPYSVFDLTTIVRNYAKQRRFLLDEDGYFTVANTSRGSPRIAKQRFDRIKLMLMYYNRPHSAIYASEMLNLMGIQAGSYTSEDIRYLEYLSSISNSSLDNICGVLQINKVVIQREIEPYLLAQGNIQITSKGRKFIKWPLSMTARY